MSWILGFTGASLKPALRERLVALHPAALRVTEEPDCYLATGGLAETCHAGTLDHSAGAWAVVGLGIQLHEDHCTFLDTADWQAQLEKPQPDVSALDGHFVAVRYQKGRLDCFTDQTGTRTIYFTQLQDGIAFSTRLDWLARLRRGAEIDLAALGSHWLSFHQLATESLVRDIRRLGPGGHAVIIDQELEIHEKPWLPEIGESDPDGSAFERVLSAFSYPHCNNGSEVSISLSGGMDSRLVLAMRMDALPVRTHSFGPDDLPDARIGRLIAEGEGLHHLALHAPIPDAETCLSMVQNHMAATLAISTASAVVGLHHLPTLHDKGFTIIDGAMGEIVRRKFLNRLLLFSRSALRTGNIDAILPFIRFPRADFFSQDAKAVLEQGFRDQVAALWGAMPDPHTLGEENFLDILRVRTVLPNFYGYEQNRTDGVIQNYMPFAQPALLRAVFQLPLSLRRGGQLVRRLIRSRHASLTHYPLAKGGLPHPFWLPAFPAAVWTKMRTRQGHGYTNSTRQAFLNKLQSFVLDAVHSQEVQSYAGYDATRIATLAEGYYSGKTELAVSLDWWLAFEMWRRSLQGG